VEGGVKVVSGRIKVSNAYGSELLPLTLTATAQYYTATGWVNSITDSVTNLVLAASYPVGAGSTAVTLTPSTGDLSSGKLTIRLGAPGVTGTATITPTTAPGYLPVTSGTATFGVYKGNNSYIYRRESY
jgi:MSHA biogenesis protein MshQ